MVTQLLFGETFEILEEQEKWVKIKNSYDGYDSWIGKKQFQLIDGKTYIKLCKETPPLSFEIVQPITSLFNQNVFPILLGSSLPFLKNQELEIEKSKYKYEGHCIRPSGTKKTRSKIVEYSFLYLNAPYLWGGRSPFGIDCSGFTQMVLKLNGISALRDAAQQTGMGKTIDFIEESKPGDLAFFDNEKGEIIHVGILLDQQKIIHASGKVRIDKFDHYGIYNEEKQAYTHQLRLIKAFL
jgi:hypothetical protein